MKKGDKDYQRLMHIVKYCEKLSAIHSEMRGYDNFIARHNYEKIDVSAFYIGQIGELSHGLSDDFQKEHNDIPWKQIVDMRNTLIHRYGTRDTRIVWDVIAEDIPILNRKCRELLRLQNPAIEEQIKLELKQETDIEL